MFTTVESEHSTRFQGKCQQLTGAAEDARSPPHLWTDAPGPVTRTGPGVHAYALLTGLAALPLHRVDISESGEPYHDAAVWHQHD